MLQPFRIDRANVFQLNRNVARLMFVDHKATSWVRDRMVEHYPARKIIAQIVEASRTPF